MKTLEGLAIRVDAASEIGDDIATLSLEVAAKDCQFFFWASSGVVNEGLENSNPAEPFRWGAVEGGEFDLHRSSTLVIVAELFLLFDTIDEVPDPVIRGPSRR